MSYINRRSKVFLAGQKKIIIPVRSEARLKSYFSTIDARAWSDIVEERRQHILEYTAKNKEGFCLDKFIPLQIIFNAVVARENIELNKLRKKVKCLEKMIEVYSKIELTESQQREINKLRLEIEKVCGKLNRIQSITRTHERLDSGEYSDIQTKNKKESIISLRSNGAELDKLSNTSKISDTKSKISNVSEIDKMSKTSKISDTKSKSSNVAEIEKMSKTSKISDTKSKSSNVAEIEKMSKTSKISDTKSKSSNVAEIEKMSKTSKISDTKSKSSNVAEIEKMSKTSKISDTKSKSSNVAEIDKMSEISEYSDAESESKRDIIISEISKDTRSTNTDSIDYEDKLIGGDELAQKNQTASCDISPRTEDFEREFMKKELDDLRSISKEAEMLKLERDRLQIQLNELSCLHDQYDNLRLKCSCLESAAQERDVYKQKYDEIISMECKCQILQSQVDAAKDVVSERDALVKQVCDLKNCKCKQEEEVKTLMTQVDNLTRNRDEIQVRTRDELSTMRDEIEKKDQVIATLEERLPGVQTQLRSSIQRVSCKIKCLKTRIEELEGKLEKSQTENEDLKRQVKENDNSLKGAMEVIKSEYERLNTMKGELEAAQAENKKLQQIANKMIALTGDDQIRKVLKQSECAVNRAVEELRKQYTEWNYLRSNKKKGNFSGDDSNKILCRCKDDTESERNEQLKQNFDEMQSERKELEIHVEQTKNEDLSYCSSRLKIRCTCECKAKSERNGKLKGLDKIQREKEKFESPVEQTKNDDVSNYSKPLKIRCRCKDKSKSEGNEKLKEELNEIQREVGKLERHVEQTKNDDVPYCPLLLKTRCRCKSKVKSERNETFKELNEIQREEGKLERHVEQTKDDDVSYCPLLKTKCRCKGKANYERNEIFKEALNEIQREEAKLERLVEKTKNDDVSYCPSLLKTRCRCKGKLKFERDEKLEEETNEIQEEEGKLERPVEKTKNDDVSYCPSLLKTRCRCKDKVKFERDEKLEEELNEIQEEEGKLERPVEKTRNDDVSYCPPLLKTRCRCKCKVKSEIDETLKKGLNEIQEKEDEGKLERPVEKNKNDDVSYCPPLLKTRCRCKGKAKFEVDETLKKGLNEMQEKEDEGKLERSAEKTKNVDVSYCPLLLKTKCRCKGKVNFERSEKLKEEFDEIQRETDKLERPVERTKNDNLSYCPSQLKIRCRRKNKIEPERNKKLKVELEEIQREKEKLEISVEQTNNADLSSFPLQLKIRYMCMDNVESESDEKFKEKLDKIRNEEESLEKLSEQVRHNDLLEGSQQLKIRCRCKDDTESENNKKLKEEMDKVQRDKEILEICLEQIRNDDLSCCPSQLKIICGCKDDTESENKKNLKQELDKVQKEKEILEKFLEQIENGLSCVPPQLKIKCRCKDDAEYESNEKLKEALSALIQREKETLEHIVVQIGNNDLCTSSQLKIICNYNNDEESESNEKLKEELDNELSCYLPQLKISCIRKDDAESESNEKLELELDKIQREDKLVEQIEVGDQCGFSQMKIICKYEENAECEGREQLKKELDKILREKEKLEKLVEQIENGGLSCGFPELKIICRYKDDTESENNEKLKEELDEIQREKEKIEKFVEQIKNDLSYFSPPLIYSFKNNLCKFTRIATEDDRRSGKYA